MSAQQRIEDTQRQVESTLGDLERNFGALDHSGVIRPLNGCIDSMNGLTVHYDAIGSQRTREAVEMANAFVAKHNDILKRIESLSTKAKSKLGQPRPQPPSRAIVEETVELAPPRQSQQPQQPVRTQIQTQAPVQTYKPLSSAARVALNEFARLYSQYQTLQAMDVWTGRSNNLVSAWASFCRDHSPALSAAVNGREGTADEIQELKNTINLFNTFAGDLTAKIRSLQINDHQRRVIESFSPEHDRLISGFRACLPDLDRAGEYYEKLVELETRLRDLGIPDHPTVKAALDGVLGTQNQMEEILQDIANRQAQALDQVTNMVMPPVRHQAQANATYANEEIVEEFSFPPPQQPAPPEPVKPVSQGTQTAPKFCGECGTPTGGKRFCGECGHKFF